MNAFGRFSLVVIQKHNRSIDRIIHRIVPECSDNPLLISTKNDSVDVRKQDWFPILITMEAVGSQQP